MSAVLCQPGAGVLPSAAPVFTLMDAVADLPAAPAVVEGPFAAPDDGPTLVDPPTLDSGVSDLHAAAAQLSGLMAGLKPTAVRVMLLLRPDVIPAPLTAHVRASLKDHVPTASPGPGETTGASRQVAGPPSREGPSSPKRPPPRHGPPSPNGPPSRRGPPGLVDAVVSDVLAAGHPWLGVVSPMQSGKTKSLAAIIERTAHEFDEVIVLSPTIKITGQITADMDDSALADGYDIFDADHKGRGHITVASILTLVRHLDEFEKGRRRLILLDEAYFTQSPTVRKILIHFGLAQGSVHSGDIKPLASGSVLVGLSGTGAGIKYYHPSYQLPYLEARRLKITRELTAERVFPKASSEVKKTAVEGYQVWWKPTEENALALAQDYLIRIHGEKNARKARGRYRKNLIYVPTIPHASLLQGALRKLMSRLNPGLVHSYQTEAENAAALDCWDRGGAVISVRQLARGFRGTGTGAIFHTYQTTSEELFAQRTGRGWGTDGGAITVPLFVLEATWDRRQIFTNIARLLGLADYPKDRLTSAEVEKILRKRVEEAELIRDFEKSPEAGRLSPLFANVPLVAAWRDFIRDAVARTGGVGPFARLTGIDPVVVTGFVQGALPIRLSQAAALRDLCGGYDAAIERWVRLWHEVVGEIHDGARLSWQLPPGLSSWHDTTTKELAAKTPDITRLGHLLDYHLRASLAMPVTAEEAQALTQAWELFSAWEKVSEDERIVVRRPVANISLVRTLRPEIVRKLQGSAPLEQWALPEDWTTLYKVLSLYLQGVAHDEHAPPDQRDSATAVLERLDRLMFLRNSWPREHAGEVPAVERLRMAARRVLIWLVADDSARQRMYFRGLYRVLPPDLEGWLWGQDAVVDQPFLYQINLVMERLVGHTKEGLKGSANPAVIEAVFDWQGWSRTPPAPKTPEDTLRNELRRRVARYFFGPPRRHDGQYLYASDAEHVACTDWLAGRAVTYNRRFLCCLNHILTNTGGNTAATRIAMAWLWRTQLPDELSPEEHTALRAGRSLLARKSQFLQRLPDGRLLITGPTTAGYRSVTISAAAIDRHHNDLSRATGNERLRAILIYGEILLTARNSPLPARLRPRAKEQMRGLQDEVMWAKGWTPADERQPTTDDRVRGPANERRATSAGPVGAPVTGVEGNVAAEARDTTTLLDRTRRLLITYYGDFADHEVPLAASESTGPGGVPSPSRSLADAPTLATWLAGRLPAGESLPRADIISLYRALGGDFAKAGEELFR